METQCIDGFTDMSQAWGEVERLAAKRWAVSMVRQVSGTTDVTFRHYDLNGWADHDISVSAGSALEAISRGVASVDEWEANRTVVLAEC